jgi:hypothetical protein
MHHTPKTAQVQEQEMFRANYYGPIKISGHQHHCISILKLQIANNKDWTT